MKKSELKRYILEALTPDEAAKVEPKYKETYAAMIKGKGPLKLKKYDNPDAVVRGRVVNTIKNESLKLAEKLGKTADVGDYKDDFRKSDAPQFKGKSKKKRDQMATAAFLNKEDQNLDEEISNVTFQKHAGRVEDLLRQLIGATKAVDASQDDTEEDVEELDQSIDYLAAAITDKDPIDIAVDQSTFGRLAKPTKEEKTLEEIDAMMEESAYEAGRKAKENKLPVKDIKKAIRALLKKEGGAAGLGPILKLAKDFDNVTQIDVEDILDNDMKDVEKHRDGDYILKEDAKEKSEKNYSNYFKKMDKNRLEEFVKAALMKETSTDKYDDNPALKGKQSDLPDGLQKAIIKKSKGKVNEGFLKNLKNFSAGILSTLGIQKYGFDIFTKITEIISKALPPEQAHDFGVTIIEALQTLTEMGIIGESTNESFDSLSKKIDKQKGKSKKDADNIAGYVANIKRKGGGKGPTAKQKKRMAEQILKELRGNINEALNKDLKDVGMDIAKYLKEKGLEPKFIQGENLKLYQDFPENGSLLSLMDGGARLEIAVNDSKIDTLKEIIKKYNLQSLQSLKQTGGWADDPKKKSQSKGEIYITSEKPQRRGKAFTLELKRFDPSEIK